MVSAAMRVLHRDPKHGEIKLQIQNLDDLWHLDNLLQPNDLVWATTYRREEKKKDKIRPERMEKKRVKLGIRVTKVEFQEFTEHLRITGVIEEGPQDHGSHHTLNVTIDDQLSIVKEWRESEFRRIEDAVKASEQPLVSFLALDDDEATLAQMRQYGLKEVATIRASGHGKMFPTGEAKEAYLNEILTKVRQSKLEETLIILGPGFAREEFMEFLKAKEPKIAERARTFAANHVGMQGIQEALKGGLGSKIVSETRLGQETMLIEELLEEIAKDGLFAYGPANIDEAVSAGAVDKLLVLEDRLRSKETEELLRNVERQNGKVVVISRHHEAGKKLDSLGGFAAFLRFKLG